MSQFSSIKLIFQTVVMHLFAVDENKVSCLKTGHNGVYSSNTLDCSNNGWSLAHAVIKGRSAAHFSLLFIPHKWFIKAPSLLLRLFKVSDVHWNVQEQHLQKWLVKQCLCVLYLCDIIWVTYIFLLDSFSTLSQKPLYFVHIYSKPSCCGIINLNETASGGH